MEKFPNACAQRHFKLWDVHVLSSSLNRLILRHQTDNMEDHLQLLHAHAAGPEEAGIPSSS